MKLNRRGYMLVEIVLATAIAFGMAYFLLNMTIKLKNKNDDLLVETMVTTDQAIIANAIMSNLADVDNCTDINSRLTFSGKKVLIDGNVIDILSDYASLPNTFNPCRRIDNVMTINIPITVTQLPDKDFMVELYWKID